MPVQEFTTEELKSEEWRSVDGYFSGIYSVSNLGRVRRDTQRQGTQAGRILLPSTGTDGYLYATLSLHSSVRRYSVQRLVTCAFLGPTPKGHNINHADGVKTNNRLHNLEYVTFSANSKHAVNTGLTKIGEHHGISKLTNNQVREIKAALSGCAPGTQSNLARQYGVNVTVISKIKRGEIWTHIK